MNQYIVDTEHAAKGLINAIFEEEKKLLEIEEKYAKLSAIYNILKMQYLGSDDPTDIDDPEVIEKLALMSTFSSVHNLPSLGQEVTALKRSLANKALSIDALSGALLQIAKQGISTVYGGLSSCNEGRAIGLQSLKTVVWEARNQANHCEEGNPKRNVKECFEKLKTDFGTKFDITIEPTKSKAKSILDLLEWKNYENYLRDLESLLG
ncbi:hypothetical protein [uncultured Chitinophaga sp.]|uniref:hypothetical protein n=1 Tax=uncultured Chitinophaga sp. TaxID=339340 RepID=UPI0025CD3CF8|nr:hypothetical protein [uncultured Chitinophaga sp.]